MYIKNQKIASKEFDETTVLVDPDEKELLELNPVAGEIWRLIDGSNDVEKITARVCEKFDIAANKAGKDVAKFVKKLLDMEVIIERK